MFQIIFPMKAGTDKKELKGIMPQGWILKNSGYDLKEFFIVEEDGAKVGSLIVMDDKKVVLKVDESLPYGKIFWQDFAKQYPELDPFIVRYGALYRSDNNENYELDELPNPEIITANELAHYGEYKFPFYVSYSLGNWHSNESLTVLSYQMIYPGGHLGHKEAPRSFKLIIGK